MNGGVLDPAGEGAGRIAGLAWFLLIASAVVVVIVSVLVAVVAYRRRRSDGSIPPPDLDADGGRRMVIFGGVILPALLLPITFGATLWTMAAADTGGEELTIEITAHEWFWDVSYPDLRVETANEIHLPVGVPVQLVVESADVIHSLWVPELDRKIDVLPGERHFLVVTAEETGTFEGRCAEFCGLQHANMHVVVVAETAEAFDDWAEHTAEPAAEPATAAAQDGLEVFRSSCTYCHTIDGTGATGDLGPVLTHLASRRDLGAGAVPNTPGHLAGWILDSQAAKPGNLMPPIDLTGEDVEDLLAYLETLE